MSNMFVIQGLWVHSAFPLPLPTFKVSHHCFRSITHPLPFVGWKPFQWVLIIISLTIILNLSEWKICYGIFQKMLLAYIILKECFIDLTSDWLIKDAFHEKPLFNFWMWTKTDVQDLLFSVPFDMTCLFESGFSELLYMIKTRCSVSTV